MYPRFFYVQILYFIVYLLPTIRENTNTNTIAPINAGTIANPPITGPQLPNNDEPIQAPIKPAIMLPIIPPGTSLPTTIPAKAPITPPTIKDQIKPNIIIPPLVTLNSYGTKFSI